LKSLVKNIFTTIVALTLLISTTGLQVYQHICVSHDFAGVSLLESPQCEKNHSVVTDKDDCCKIEEVQKESCCETEIAAETYPVNYTSDAVDCCISIVDYKKIDENIYPPLDKKEFSFEITAITTIDTEDRAYKTSILTHTHSNDLPPQMFGRELLQKIHQLKIDTPIC